ncbi:hypothetical protein CCHL11_01509 [Colletotrichum chlorophyti]|uniref:Myb-like DNA-binding domain-containing protein n=1 Tax=Colletotrichum chlorophyti TaxID=708187 RepID=A0A1Q8RYH7_9PEZI|nr:hypothetical protein CCHL11_01509 [Colletotrichum chlorophyti]
MSSNTDNQMTRFLFAILKQKNLKDIDWNAVAHDPILTQPITNGHAARMRYSRFRSAMLGLEPQKRNRTAANKNRVTKSKKELKPKKEEEDDKQRVKPEPGTLEALRQSGMPVRSPVTVKQEHCQPSYRQQFTPTSMASPPAPECQPAFPPRLLTPCSDDMFSAPHSLQFSPSANIMATHAAFDIPSAIPCAHEQHHHHEHDHNSWAPSPIYSAFDAAYDIEGFGVGGVCDHQHIQGHTDEMHGSPALNSLMPEHMNIKNEHWDSQFHS